MHRSLKARYAKGKVLVQCPSSDGFKTREARLAEHVGGRYTRRERGYIMSTAAHDRFQGHLFRGDDASAITGALRSAA